MRRVRKVQGIMLKDIAALHTDSESGVTEILYADGTSQRVSEPAEVLFDRWCTAFGSTMKGRFEAVRKLTGVRTKLPLLIRETDVLLFYPIRSMYSKEDNYWINDNLTAAVLPERRTAVHLIFLNGFQMEVPCDVRIIRRQQEICRKIRNLLAEADREL